MRKKLLVVEDEPDQVELLTYQLSKAGFAVGTALDGIEALKKARTVTPDLILLDLMLPELDGFAVWKAKGAVWNTIVIANRNFRNKSIFLLYA